MGETNPKGNIMALAPPAGYLADGPDGHLVCDLGDTTELVDFENLPSTPPKSPGKVPTAGSQYRDC